MRPPTPMWPTVCCCRPTAQRRASTPTFQKPGCVYTTHVVVGCGRCPARNRFNCLLYGEVLPAIGCSMVNSSIVGLAINARPYGVPLQRQIATRQPPIPDIAECNPTLAVDHKGCWIAQPFANSEVLTRRFEHAQVSFHHLACSRCLLTGCRAS